MKKGKLMGKVFGMALVFVMVGSMLGGLLGAITPQTVEASTLADGKGMWIWKIWELGENVNQIINKLESAGVEWVTVKCGDSDSYYLNPGKLMYNWLIANGYSDFSEVVTQFHNAGIRVFGWHYVYSYDLWGVSGVTEADVSNQILDISGIDGLIIDAEAEYEGAGKGEIAENYMIDIRNEHPTSFIAYSTFARINAHLWFPYIEFGRYCDAVMPQAYWKDRPTTPQNEVDIMKQQWDYWHGVWEGGGYGDSVKPLIPVGQSYSDAYGYASGSEITEFCTAVLSYGYDGVSLWRYGTMTSGAWSAYAAIGAEDNTPPTVDAFDVTPGSVTLGNAFTISYTVSDTGGYGLGWIQLWRKYETASWEQVDSTTLSGVGNGPYSGSFSDIPLTVGNYWYGIHVGDDAGNWVTETDSGFSPIQVEVIQENNPPQLSNGYVGPSSGTPSTNFYYYVTYFDPDGDSPSVKQVFIDGTAYTINLYSGSASNGIYRYGPKNLSAGGTHYYFFYFEDGKGGWDRLPSGVDMYLGPTVTGPNNPPNTPSNPSPANHATGVSINSDLSWSGGDPDAGDTVTHDVYFGTSSTPPLVSNDQSGNTYDPGTLSYNTKYYWKIIATDDHGSSTEGPLWDFMTTSADQVVTFPDPNLEAAIREAIGKPTGDIYQSELQGLTELYAYDSNIADLSGLEHCTNLTWLYLYNNQIRDLSPVSDLTKLTFLACGANQISDISPISDLTSLTYLHLQINQISDISPISDLTGLIILDLSGNSISDITALSGLANLLHLVLLHNQISDISPISNLTSLTGLWLEDNQITDIGSLVDNAGLSQGDEVDLKNNPLSALSINTYIPQLEARGVTVYYDVPKTWYVDDDLVNCPAADFTTIQEAVDEASSGDTIIVYPGTYTENVDVNKDHLTIRSESGAEVTIVQVANPNDHVFEVTADYVEINGFTVTGATIWLKAGVMVEREVVHCTLLNNVILNNSLGICLGFYSSNNILDGNTVMGNQWSGIRFETSSYNKLSNNMILDNHHNLDIWGGGALGLISYIHDIDTSNTVNGKPIQYLVNEDDIVIDSTWNIGYLGLVNCTDVVVEDLTLDNYNGQGILLAYSTNSRVENVNVANNCYYGIILSHSCNIGLTNNVAFNNGNGIELDYSSSCTLINNTASNNDLYGISLHHSNDNILKGNMASSNTLGIYLHDSPNNTLADNTMLGNERNFGVMGGQLADFIQNIDISNTANGKPVQYLVNRQDLVIDSNWDVGYLGVVDCKNIVVEDLSLNNNEEGVLLAYSSDSRIEGITAQNNWCGLVLIGSSNNTLSNNLLSNNYGHGIEVYSSNHNILINNICSNNGIGASVNGAGIGLLECSSNTLNGNMVSNNDRGVVLSYSDNNSIYLNNFIDNTYNVFSQGSNNAYNSPEEITYTYNGNTYTSYLGNYWSDYEDRYPGAGEIDSTGIWDTPYIIDSDADTYPLVEPFENYEIIAFPYGPFPYGYRFANGAATQNVDLLPWIEVVEGLTEDDKRIIFEETFDWSDVADPVMKEMLFSEFKDKIGKGGNCYGMVASSLMEYAHTGYDEVLETQDVDYLWNLNAPWALPLGIWDGRDMQEKPILKHILKFQLSQYGPSSQQQQAELEFSKDPIGMVQKLEEAGSNYIVGVAYCEIVEQQTHWYAHALAPYEIKEEGGKVKVYVYDPNWPDKDGDMARNDEDKAYDRYIEIDKDLNCWRYLFNGEYWPPASAAASKLVLIPIEAHYYYTYDGIPKPGGKLTGYPGPGYCLADGNISLTLTDSEGRTTGVRDDSFVEEIPGVKPIYDFFTSSGTWGEQYYIGSDTILIATIEGIDEGIYSVTKFGSGYFAGVSDISTSEGAVDSVTLSTDSAKLSFSWGQEPKTYDLVLHVDTDDGNQTFSASNILAAPGANHEYAIDWDALSEGEEGVTVQIDSDGDGTFEETITSDGELTHDEFMLQTATTIDFDPDTLNLKDEGKYVTVYVELPPGYEVSQIDISSITLNAIVPALDKPSKVGDHDKDTVPDLMVKFDGAAVKGILTVGEQVEITITGEVAEIGFEGSDTIRVIDTQKRSVLDPHMVESPGRTCCGST